MTIRDLALVITYPDASNDLVPVEMSGKEYIDGNATEKSFLNIFKDTHHGRSHG